MAYPIEITGDLPDTVSGEGSGAGSATRSGSRPQTGPMEIPDPITLLEASFASFLREYDSTTQRIAMVLAAVAAAGFRLNRSTRLAIHCSLLPERQLHSIVIDDIEGKDFRKLCELIHYELQHATDRRPVTPAGEATTLPLHVIIGPEMPYGTETPALRQLISVAGGQPVLWLSDRAPDACWLVQSGNRQIEEVTRLDTYVAAFARRHRSGDSFLHESLDIVGEDERLIQADFGSPCCLSHNSALLFEAVADHAQANPCSTAILNGTREISYAELDNLANAVASVLTQAGVGREDYVGVYIERSHLNVACLLGIHKAGAIYVPLDTEFPAARLQAVCDQLDLGFAITSHESDAGIHSLVRHTVLTRDIEDLAARQAVPAPKTVASYNDYSHVFFTSGTTGIPKGILATHRNLDHCLSAAIERYGFSADDHFVSMARSTFSISMFEMLTALRAGGSVAILSKEAFLDSEQLCLSIGGASVIHAVPSLLARIMDSLEDNGDGEAITRGVTTVISGGDMVPPELLERAKSVFPMAQVYVCYGSSEISCLGCTYEVRRDRKLQRTRVGKPFPNTRVKILDSYGNPVPLGAPGELHFSGPGVVPGYINRPETDRDKFRMIDGARFFAIGDIGRFDADGNIELLGRNDFQVQIDGNRVELQEVELLLKSFEGIQQAVVSGWSPEDNKSTQLVAYLVMADGISLSRTDLATALAEQLPAYMVPAHFVSLDYLPTNFNGKVDRKRLPSPSRANSLHTGTVAALPTSSTEECLYRIWCTYFPELDFSINDSFFDLGGNSLKAVRMLSEVARTYGFAPPLRTLLTSPSIAQLAAVIDSGATADDRRVVNELTRNSQATRTLYCCNGILQYRDLANALGGDWRVCGVALPEEANIITAGITEDENTSITDFGMIVERYIEEITADQPVGPYYLCGASFGGLIAAEVGRRLQAAGEEVRLLALFDSWYPRSVDSSMDSASLPRKFKQALRKYVLRRKDPATSDPREQARRRALDHFHDEYFDLDILLFKATDRESLYGYHGDTFLGWSGRTRSVSVYDVPGNHIGILRAGNVEHIARVIQSEPARGHSATITSGTPPRQVAAQGNNLSP